MIDLNTETKLSALDTLDIELGADLYEDPWLGVIVVDSMQPNQYKPGHMKWVLAVRPIHEGTPNIGKSGARWEYIEPKGGASKFSKLVKALTTVFPEDKKTKPGRGNLIGRVAYFQKQEGGRGQYTFEVTLPIKRATPEEQALALTLPPLDLSMAPTPSGAVPTRFEWTEERKAQAIEIIAGNSSAKIFKLAGELEDEELRAQIVSQTATDYLIAEGLLEEGDDGKAHRTAAAA